MGETAKPDQATGGWPRTVAILGVAVVAAAALYGIATMLIDNNSPFEIVLDRDAGITISAKSGEGIEVLIDKAFAESPASVGGVLQARDYYKLHSDNLINALALTDPADIPESTLKRYRKLFWELEGPFSPPGTLSEMDGRLLQALNDLENEVKETGRSNQLIAAIWQQSLNQQGIFRPRLVNAEVILVARDSTGADEFPVFYTCGGSTLINRVVTIGATRPAQGVRRNVAAEPLMGIVGFDTFIAEALGCRDNPGADFAELIAGEPLVLGLEEDSYTRLFGVVGHGSDETDEREARLARVQVEALQLPRSPQ